MESIMNHLPRELTEDQGRELVRAYERGTQDETPAAQAKPNLADLFNKYLDEGVNGLDMLKVVNPGMRPDPQDPIAVVIGPEAFGVVNVNAATLRGRAARQHTVYRVINHKTTSQRVHALLPEFQRGAVWGNSEQPGKRKHRDIS